MVLSGTLREFILADVFQLLTQQKITGKLHLTTSIEDGVVVFKNGNIVNASKDTEYIEIKLEKYLIETKKISANRIKSLLSAFNGDLNGLINEIISHAITTPEEIASFSESVIEDITCSMFLWNNGSYRFNSMRNVDKFIPGNCSIPIENIVMEAMRRFDEWNRMQSIINDDIIFVLTDNSFPSKSDAQLHPFFDSEEYLCQKIDGISPVSEFISTTPLTQYKVYETLYTLIQSQRITALSDKIAQPMHAALEKNVRKKNEEKNSTSTFFSIAIVIGFILVVILISSLIFKGIFLSQITINSYIARSELPMSIAEEKIYITKSYFKAHKKDSTLGSNNNLLEYKLISKKDLEFINLKN